MKRILLGITLIFVSFFSFSQVIDSTKVTKIQYQSEKTEKRIVKVTKEQIEASKLYKKGYALVNNNQYQEATIFFKKAIETDSTGNCITGKNGMAYSELGYCYTRLGDFDNAFKYLNESIKLNKNIPESYLSLAVIYSSQKKYQEAIDILNKSIKNVPDNAMSYVQRAFIYDYLNKDELALKDYKKSLELFEKQGQMTNSKPLIDSINEKIKSIKYKK